MKILFCVMPFVFLPLYSSSFLFCFVGFHVYCYATTQITFLVFFHTLPLFISLSFFFQFDSTIQVKLKKKVGEMQVKRMPIKYRKTKSASWIKFLVVDRIEFFRFSFIHLNVLIITLKMTAKYIYYRSMQWKWRDVLLFKNPILAFLWKIP